VSATLAALLPRQKPKGDRSFLEAARDHYRRRGGSRQAGRSGPGGGKIHPQYLSRLVSEHADDDAVFTCDVGTASVWAARYIRMNGKRRLIGSFNHASMANAMPQAIGAQASHKGRQVISMSGDGGFAMMLGDFITLTQMDLPVKVTCSTTAAWASSSWRCRPVASLDTAAVALKNPISRHGRGHGRQGHPRRGPAEARERRARDPAHKGPALLDVVSARQELVMPPKAPSTRPSTSPCSL
jgi:pyruvate dehydrogenase (quinone)